MTDVAPDDTVLGDIPTGEVPPSEVPGLDEILANINAGGGAAFNVDPFAIFYSAIADPNAEIFDGTETVSTRSVVDPASITSDDPGEQFSQRRLALIGQNRFGDGFFDEIAAPTPVSIEAANRALDAASRTGFSDLENQAAGTTDSGLFDLLDENGLLTRGTDERETTTTAGDLVREFFEMSDDERARIQRILYVGGFYGSGMRFGDIPFGNADEASYQAWATAVTRTARLNAAGNKMTIDEVIEEAARTAGIGVDGGFVDQSGQDIIVSLSDPIGIREQADTIARQNLGRQATEAEERMIVGMIHGLQRTSQTAAQRSANSQADGAEGLHIVNPEIRGHRDPSGERIVTGETPFDIRQDPDVVDTGGSDAGSTTEVIQPDVAARTAEALRSANPGEAEAMDLLSVLSTVSSMFTAR